MSPCHFVQSLQSNKRDYMHTNYFKVEHRGIGTTRKTKLCGSSELREIISGMGECCMTGRI